MKERCTNHQLVNKFVDYYYICVDSFPLGNNEVVCHGYYPKGTLPHDKAVMWFDNYFCSKIKKTVDGGIVLLSQKIRYQLTIHGKMSLCPLIQWIA